MADIVLAYIVMAYIVMVRTVPARTLIYMAMAYIVMAFIVMAYIGMAYTVMAYGLYSDGLYSVVDPDTRTTPECFFACHNYIFRMATTTFFGYQRQVLAVWSKHVMGYSLLGRWGSGPKATDERRLSLRSKPGWSRQQIAIGPLALSPVKEALTTVRAITI